MDSDNSASLLILVAMLFVDYTKVILDDLQLKRAAGKLPVELTEPSAGRLRDLCLEMVDKRYDRRDEPALEKFFGKAGDQKTRVKSIADCELSKFKPLINFLNKPGIKTEPKNVELLAWLIDFRGRPYEFGKLYVPDSAAASPGDRVGDKTKNEPEPAPTNDGEIRIGPGRPLRQRAGNSKKRIFIVSGAIALLCLVLTRVLTAGGPCMRWSGDRYEAVGCGQHFGDTPVVPLDSNRLIHFRKINRPDTITENALASIWCVRYRGKYECYTDAGSHPIDTNLKLKKLTDYILIRYVNPKIGSIKISQ